MSTEKSRYKSLWGINCAQLCEFDTTIAEKDEQISQLELRLRSMGKRVARERRELTGDREEEPHSTLRRGRAPPVEMFSGEDVDNTLDDWIPSLTRAAKWNGWTADEQLLQLAGHLKGRARQEWAC